MKKGNISTQDLLGVKHFSRNGIQTDGHWRAGVLHYYTDKYFGSVAGKRRAEDSRFDAIVSREA